MKLTIAESFYVLIHHPEKPRLLVGDPPRSPGVVGAIFMDLSLAENIIIEDEKIKVKSVFCKLLPAHKEILDYISESKKQRKPKVWISRFTHRSSQARKGILENLEKRGIIEIEYKRFLFFPYMKTQLIKPDVRMSLINELRDIVFKGKQVDIHMGSLLGIIEACKLHKLICNGREELKQGKKSIKEIIQSDMISQGVGKVIQEMQAAMMAAIIASTAATTAAAASASS